MWEQTNKLLFFWFITFVLGETALTLKKTNGQKHCGNKAWCSKEEIKTCFHLVDFYRLMAVGTFALSASCQNANVMWISDWTWKTFYRFIPHSWVWATVSHSVSADCRNLAPFICRSGNDPLLSSTLAFPGQFHKDLRPHSKTKPEKMLLRHPPHAQHRKQRSKLCFSEVVWLNELIEQMWVSRRRFLLSLSCWCIKCLKKVKKDERERKETSVLAKFGMISVFQPVTRVK